MNNEKRDNDWKMAGPGLPTALTHTSKTKKRRGEEGGGGEGTIRGIAIVMMSSQADVLYRSDRLE